MPTGSCLCKTIKISYSGLPASRSICHCNDCRKMSNIQTYQIPKPNFEVVSDAKPKEWTVRSDHGNEITNHFCDTCGTILFRTGGAAINVNNIGLRAAVLDDQTLINEEPPVVEVYVERRPKWLKAIEGAMQLDGTYTPVDERSREMFRAFLEKAKKEKEDVAKGE